MVTYTCPGREHFIVARKHKESLVGQSLKVAKGEGNVVVAIRKVAQLSTLYKGIGYKLVQSV